MFVVHLHLGRMGNSSLTIKILWNEIRMFLSSVVCLKPLTYTHVIVAWPLPQLTVITVVALHREELSITLTFFDKFFCATLSHHSLFFQSFFFVLLRAISPFNSYRSVNHVWDPVCLKAWRPFQKCFRSVAATSIFILCLCVSGWWTVT